MDTTIRTLARGMLMIVASVLFSGSARAAIVDLTTAGSSGVINGAIYEQNDAQPTGSGVIDSFVRLQSNGTERGYNTTANNIFDNGSTDTFNHSITLDDVTISFRGGLPHRRFLLDINESNGGGNEMLSLDEVQIFVIGTANSSVETLTGALLDHDGTLVYRMDAGVDSWVALDYSLNSGSGSGDMLLLVPETAFAGFPGSSVVTLYSAFGGQGNDPDGFDGDFGTSDGFEEWATSVPIPEPTTWLLAATALAAMAWGRRLGAARG